MALTQMLANSEVCKVLKCVQWRIPSAPEGNPLSQYHQFAISAENAEIANIKDKDLDSSYIDMDTDLDEENLVVYRYDAESIKNMPRTICSACLDLLSIVNPQTDKTSRWLIDPTEMVQMNYFLTDRPGKELDQQIMALKQGQSEQSELIAQLVTTVAELKNAQTGGESPDATTIKKMQDEHRAQMAAMVRSHTSQMEKFQKQLTRQASKQPEKASQPPPKKNQNTQPEATHVPILISETKTQMEAEIWKEFRKKEDRKDRRRRSHKSGGTRTQHD